MTTPAPGSRPSASRSAAPTSRTTARRSPAPSSPRPCPPAHSTGRARSSSCRSGMNPRPCRPSRPPSPTTPNPRPKTRTSSGTSSATIDGPAANQKTSLTSVREVFLFQSLVQRSSKGLYSRAGQMFMYAGRMILPLLMISSIRWALQPGILAMAKIGV